MLCRNYCINGSSNFGGEPVSVKKRYSLYLYLAVYGDNFVEFENM